MVKKIIGTLLGKLGYEITRKDRGGFNSAYLARLCAPGTVFDAGVGPGTPELYGAYPGAKFILVEPLAEFKETLDRIAGKYNCVICNKALGEVKGTLVMSVETDAQLSSFCQRPRAEAPPESRPVEVTTLDAILAENPGIARPILIKIDVEGYELNVLRGGARLLKLAEMVIVETSVAKRFENGAALADVIAFMDKNGFEVFDFLTVRRGTDKTGASFVDVVFKAKQ